MTIRQRLTLTYLALIVLPLILLTGLSYYRCSSIIQEQAEKSSLQMLDQAYDAISYKLDLIRRIIWYLGLDNSINDILSQAPEDYGIGSQLDDYLVLQELINELRWSSELSGIRLFVDTGALYAEERQNIFPLRDIEKEVWYGKMARGAVPSVSLMPLNSIRGDNNQQVEVVSLAMVVRDRTSFDRIVAVVVGDMETSEFQGILEPVLLTPGSTVSFWDGDNRLLVKSGSEEIPLEPEIVLSRMGRLEKGRVARIDGYMVGLRESDDMGWKILSFIPLGELLLPTVKLGAELMLLCFLVALIAFYSARKLTRPIALRLKNLGDTMIRMEEGNLAIRSSVDGEDEIGALQEGFNVMAEQLEEMIEQRFLNGQQTKLAEIKALQAQINPHFLYNTLDLIGWLSFMEGSERTQEVAGKLAEFYKVSLSRGMDMVPLSQELEHVRLYVSIENIRFENAVAFAINVPEALLDCTVPKLILQPLVENSFLHGIKEKREGKGGISLEVREERGVLSIRIIDNGVGMDVEKMNEFLSGGGSSQGRGYGVFNIHQRISLQYGKAFGLRYIPPPGGGTEVRITLPAVQGRENDKNARPM